MRVVCLIGALALAGCGGGAAEDTGPSSLHYKFDDSMLVSIDPAQQPDVIASKQDWDVANMSMKKIENDLNDMDIQVHQAQNEAKAAELIVDSARTEKKAASRTADMTRQNNAERDLHTAQLGLDAAEAKVEFQKARRDAQKKMLLWAKYDLAVKEANWHLQKAKVAQSNNIRPSGFDEQNYEKQFSALSTKATKVKGDADRMNALAEERRKAWDQRQQAASAAKGEVSSTPSDMAPPASAPTASQ
jgi:hypothetical protein